ncbi:MAG: TonB-dependent receptor plug domain-containing protein, partial [Acidobacteriota bacterium]|nr:TonB-dependent receptor plug domain-containing protein [Acidobacteriota bacterium]
MLTYRTHTIILAVLIAVFTPNSIGQESKATVRIEVTAESAPASDARVTVNGIALRTGRDGIVTTQVAQGPVTISVSMMGYFPASASISADSVQEFVVQVDLQPEKKVEEEIKVYATRNDIRVEDSPLHVEVIQREEIEEKMIMTPGDIVMMLNEMGGVRVQTTSPSLGAASVRIQGMVGRYTSFLSDGLPLFGQQGAGLGLLQIPPTDLGQVEVIKGNASALYGGAAMAGVVNLISRRPKAEPIHELLINESTLGATDVSLFLAAPLSVNWSSSLLGNGDWQRQRDLNADGWADLAGYARGVVRPRFYWDDKNGHTALLTGGVTYEDRAGGTVSGAVLPATGQPYREALNTRRYDGGGNLQWLFAGRYVVNARFSDSDQQHDHRFGEITENDRHELTFGEVSVRGAFGRNTWVAGAAAQRDAYRPVDVPRFAYTYVVPGMFLQDDLNVVSWLSVSASARVDFHNRYGTFFSPRLSALIRRSGWTSRLSVGQGFFAPTPLTEETEAAGLNRLTLPRPLVAERGRTASVDLTRSLGPLTITGTLFASNIDHPVFVDRGTIYSIINLAAPTKNRGAELLATWRKAPLSATASYSYVHSTELEPSGGRANVPLTP